MSRGRWLTVVVLWLHYVAAASTGCIHESWSARLYPRGHLRQGRAAQRVFPLMPRLIRPPAGAGSREYS